MATVTIRQAGVTRAQAGALLTHEYRATLAKEGRVTSHDNEGIDPARTNLNRDYLFVNGIPQPLQTVGQIHKELDRRLEGASGTRTHPDGSTTKVALRKDAKVLRNFIVQLDPEKTGEVAEWLAKPEAERRRDTSLMVDTLIRGHIGEVYGKHNLLSMTLHLDEKSPHIHLMVTPIDDEGRVRQASFIDGKQAMRDFWQKGREKLREAGYEADLVAGDLRPHESLRAFKTRTAKAKEEAKEAEKARAEQEAKAKAQQKARMEAQKAQYDQQISHMEAHKKALEAETDLAESANKEALALKDALTEENERQRVENERQRAENEALKDQKARWYKENGDFLEGWISKQGFFGRPSEENRQMLNEAMAYREEAQGKLAEAKKVEARAKDHTARTREEIARRADEALLAREEAVRAKESSLEEKDREISGKLREYKSLEKTLTSQLEERQAMDRKIEENKRFASRFNSLSLAERDKVVALAGYYAHRAVRESTDSRNAVAYRQGRPVERRYGVGVAPGLIGEYVERAQRELGAGVAEPQTKADVPSYSDMPSRAPAPSQSRDFSL